ncbi:MAG: hypothetical protein KJT01_15390, partial [Gemmatimonadetes bacterium]|nr:hypothetical protein [Gemmatimonadota bacterium]
MKIPLSFHSITRRVTGGRVTPRATRLLATLAMLGAASPALAGAQSIGIQVGDSARVVVNPGATVQVPLRVDLSAAGALNIASLNGNLGVTGSGLVATGWSVASNEASTGLVQTQGALASGSRLLSYFSATRLAATATLGTASFTAINSTGMGSDSYSSALIRYAVTSAGTEAGT